MKLFDRGVELRSVTRIMEANGRLPEFLRGDLWAGIAAVRVGAQRVRELVERYGAGTFLESLGRLHDHGEEVALRALAELPHGRFELAEEQDDGAVYRVAVELAADGMLVDLRDNPDQDPGPANVSRDGALIAAQMALMNLVGAGTAANAGHFRPLEVLTRPGSVFEPCEPAAMAVYYEARVRLYDLILRCLAPHLEGRLPSGGFSSICGTFIGGRHPDTGRHFTIVEPEVGGWGATAERDGISAQFSILRGDTYNCPAEIAEARYGLYVDRLELSSEPGGEGRFRGGKGILLEYHVRGDGCFLTCAYTRSRKLPWGQAGGNDGSSNYVEVARRDGSLERFAVATTLPVNAGDVIRINTGNGGGYGPPAGRDPERARDDARNGFPVAFLPEKTYVADNKTRRPA